MPHEVCPFHGRHFVFCEEPQKMIVNITMMANQDIALEPASIAAKTLMCFLLVCVSINIREEHTERM